MDEGQKSEMAYRPPLSRMKNAIWIIGVGLWLLIVVINDSQQLYDPYYVLGVTLLLLFVVTFQIAPLVIQNRSPKLVTNKIGTTTATQTPIKVIPAQGGYPAFGIWAAGSVRALFIYGWYSTVSYVIAPLDQAIVIGEGRRGVNVFINTWLETYADHDELPPHVVSALRGLKSPNYNPDLPAEFGQFPLVVNELSREQRETFRDRLKEIGVSFDKMDDMIAVVEEYAVIVSPFQYPFTQESDPKVMLTHQLSATNKYCQELEKMNRTLKKEMTEMLQLYRYAKDPMMPEGFFDRFRNRQEIPDGRPEDRS